MKKILRTKLIYNCCKVEDFNGEWFTRYDRSYDMVVTASTEEDCIKTMESFESAIAKAEIQNSFDSNVEPRYDESKNVWIGIVEVYVSNNWVTEEKEAIKSVYSDWKEDLKNPSPTVELENEIKEESTENKIDIVKSYVEYLKTTRKYSLYSEIGLVFNRIDEYLEKYNDFMIWKQSGENIYHDVIKYEEVKKWLELKRF